MDENNSGPSSSEIERKQKHKEAHRGIIQGLFACLKNAQLYPEDHPNLKQSCQNLEVRFADVLHHKFEVTLLHNDGIFVIDDELFIDESILMIDLLYALEEAKIFSLNFLPGIQEAEIKSLFLFIVNKMKNKGEAAKPTPFSCDHIDMVFESKQGTSMDIRQIRGLRIRNMATTGKEWEERTGKIFEKILEEQNFPMAELTNPLDKLIDNIQKDPETFGMALLQESPNFHVQHAVHTLFLSIFLGHQLGFDVPTLKSLGMAALFHDIGRLLLPTEFKTGYLLTKEDIDFIQLHPRDGAALLAGIPEIPVMVIRVALEHHIGVDGLGYPTFPEQHKPHFFSHIVGLADFVSWRTVSETTYHKPISLHRIIQTIIRRSGSQFHPLLVKMLIPMFGLHPIGTKLTLSTGEKAIALESNVRNIVRPSIALSKSEGRWEYHCLTEFSKEAPDTFERSVAKSFGYKKNIAPLFDLIPRRSEPVS